jgi:hypothetical protein
MHGIIKKCRRCGEKFSPKREHGLYCTDRCAWTARAARRRKKIKRALIHLEETTREERPYG